MKALEFPLSTVRNEDQDYKDVHIKNLMDIIRLTYIYTMIIRADEDLEYFDNYHELFTQYPEMPRFFRRLRKQGFTEFQCYWLVMAAFDYNIPRTKFILNLIRETHIEKKNKGKIVTFRDLQNIPKQLLTDGIVNIHFQDLTGDMHEYLYETGLYGKYNGSTEGTYIEDIWKLAATTYIAENNHFDQDEWDQERIDYHNNAIANLYNDFKEFGASDDLAYKLVLGMLGKTTQYEFMRNVYEYTLQYQKSV